MEAQVSRLIKGGAAAIGIFATHDAFDPAVAIDVANAKVAETYDGNTWQAFKGLTTVRQAIDSFLKKNGLRHYILVKEGT
jgi:pectin methylesterase-like acyl-CoA thioesterase